MIKKGLPLTREKWISMNYGGDPPKPWCIEHEMEVPEFWRDHTASRRKRRRSLVLRGLGGPAGRPPRPRD
jgi:hypothetical protein